MFSNKGIQCVQVILVKVLVLDEITKSCQGKAAVVLHGGCRQDGERQRQETGDLN